MVGFLKETFSVHNYHYGYAIITLPSKQETSAYQQALEHTLQLIGQGYQVTIIEEQEDNRCEC